MFIYINTSIFIILNLQKPLFLAVHNPMCIEIEQHNGSIICLYIFDIFLQTKKKECIYT